MLKYILLYDDEFMLYEYTNVSVILFSSYTIILLYYYYHFHFIYVVLILCVLICINSL
jgi:hypothetical protein